MTVTLEQVQKTAENALQAMEGIKGTLTEVQQKAGRMDFLDENKFNKLADDVAAALAISQQYKAGQEATALEVKKLEAAISRPGAGDIKAKAEETKEKRHEALNTFLKKGCGSSHAADFSDFIGQKSELPEEVKALSVNSQVDGGYLVMPEFGGLINVRVFESSPMRSLASSVSIASDAYEVVLDNDEVTSGWVAETGPRPGTGTPKLDIRRIPTHEVYANPSATQKMLDDGIIDVEGWLSGKVTEKFARDEATAFISGNGAGKPTGILTHTTTGTGYDARNVQVVNSGVNGGVGYDGLVNIQNALKEFYQSNATWLMKRNTLATILKIKSGITDDNTPIFNMQYDKNAGLEMAILTRPMRFADDMPAVAADALAIAYGDFRSGYLIVDRIGIRILRDPFTNKPYVQFYTTKRVGGDVVNAEAIKLLKLAS